ncbi:MAG: hypothetical protein ABI594_20010, partial [Ginsengibacter sp.]
KYERDFTTCPNDGFYSFVSQIRNCFNDEWLTFNTDHTGNGNGNMMLVNASGTGGVFFNTIVDGLKPNTTYQFGAWMVNVCGINGSCSPLPPNISIRLYARSGKKLAGFVTGLLSQNEEPHWRKFFGYFVTPPDVSSLTIIMEDNTLGGCGNDFAMDDITFSECVKPPPVVQPKPVLAEKKINKPPAAKAEKKKLTTKVPAPKKEQPILSTEKTTTGIPLTSLPPLDEKPITKLIPQPILTRDNPVVKRIETEPGKIMIDLYDNGEIDGDTVSIYHNNELMISHAGLSDKPIHFEVEVDAARPHHELVMVANNLGSIPPNTSLMIIMANGKRYEVHISSSEQKNAKVEIDLKK